MNFVLYCSWCEVLDSPPRWPTIPRKKCLPRSGKKSPGAICGILDQMRTYNNLTIKDLESLRLELWTKSMSVNVVHSYRLDLGICVWCSLDYKSDSANGICEIGTNKKQDYLITKLEDITKTIQILEALPSADADHMLRYISITVDL